MKNKPSFNNNDLSENKNSQDGYIIPERENKTWCSFMESGFRESRNMVDKQSCDPTEASSDIIEKEPSMKKLQPEELTE